MLPKNPYIHTLSHPSLSFFSPGGIPHSQPDGGSYWECVSPERWIPLELKGRRVGGCEIRMTERQGCINGSDEASPRLASGGIGTENWVLEDGTRGLGEYWAVGVPEGLASAVQLVCHQRFSFRAFRKLQAHFWHSSSDVVLLFISRTWCSLRSICLHAGFPAVR